MHNTLIQVPGVNLVSLVSLGVGFCLPDQVARAAGPQARVRTARMCLPHHLGKPTLRASSFLAQAAN